MKNAFSVLIAIHQRSDIESNFENLINSIYSNTLLPNQVLVLVDGPIKISFKNRIKYIQEKRGFEVYFHRENIGLANILNLGLEKISNNWVIRVDGDDICLPNRFKKLIDSIKPKISIIGSYIKEIDEKKNTRIKKVPLEQKNISRYLKYRNPFNHPSVAFRVDHVLNVGGYPNFYLKEDYGLWVKMISKGYRGINIPEVLVETFFNKASYNRRSGIGYLKSDIALTFMQYRLKLINIFEFIFILILRSVIILSPSFIKIFLYNMLRSI